MAANPISFSYGVEVNADSLGILTQKLELFKKEVVPKVGTKLLDAIGEAVVRRAKQLAPVDTGNLRYNLYSITTKENPPRLRLYSAAVRKKKEGGQAPYGWYQEVGWRVLYGRRGYSGGKYTFPIEYKKSRDMMVRRKESITSGGKGTVSSEGRKWNLNPNRAMKNRNPGMSGIIKWREGKHYYRNAVDQTMERIDDFRPVVVREVDELWKGRGWELVKW